MYNAVMFSKELARQILGIQFTPADHARYEELSAKVQEGTLSADERDELEDIVNLNDLLIVLKTKAEAALRDSAA